MLEQKVQNIDTRRAESAVILQCFYVHWYLAQGYDPSHYKKAYFIEIKKTAD